MRSKILLLLFCVVVAAGALAEKPADPLVKPYSAVECASCAGWNEPHAPVRVFGNTYYVGTDGLGAVLITSPQGHVIIDGALPESAPLILENVKALGFDPKDVVLILNTHAHFDHAGGIAALQRATGARVAATERAATTLEAGTSPKDDPQLGSALDFPAVKPVERVAYGAKLKAGSVELEAHRGGAHTPGSTTWSWTSCEGDRCLRMVYADSLTPITWGTFRYTDHPEALENFEAAYKVLEEIPCDVILTPHPMASSMWERAAKGAAGWVDSAGCRGYAARSREQLARKLATEKEEK
jgi:metallo-beta-lactamase class B